MKWLALLITLVIAIPVLAAVWLLGWFMPGMRVLPSSFYRGRGR